MIGTRWQIGISFDTDQTAHEDWRPRKTANLPTPPHWIIERTEEYVAQLSIAPGSIDKPRGTCPKFNRNCPLTPEERRQKRRPYNKRDSQKPEEFNLCRNKDKAIEHSQQSS